VAGASDAHPGRAALVRLALSKPAIALAVVLGLLLGLGLYTFSYAEGFSYFSSDPKACVNCHIMRSEYDSWQKSSHHAAARCVDCHLPHELVPKLIAKADNGYRHSKAFTFEDFHEPIMITPRNAQILQDNCLACHGQFVHQIVRGSTSGPNAVKCVHCHASVGHGPPR
jgi:cytochrome c nitrite reductase small subunit